MFPRERTGIPHLPATPTEWWLSSDRIGFTGSSPEGPNSVRVTFSRRSPQCRPLDLRNQVQSREKRAWNSFPPVTYRVANDHTLTGHPNGVALIGEKSIQRLLYPRKPNSVRVTFSRRSPKCRALDLRNQVQSREKRAWNCSRRSHVRSCNSLENTESSG